MNALKNFYGVCLIAFCLVWAPVVDANGIFVTAKFYGVVGIGKIYAKFDPANKAPDVVLTNGNLTATNSSVAGYVSVRTTVVNSTGKFYVEFTVNSAASTVVVLGYCNSSFTVGTAGSAVGDAAANTVGYYQGGQIITGGTTHIYGSSYTNGTVVGMAIDTSNGQVIWYNNGVSQGTVTLYTTSGPYYLAISLYNVTDSVTANFGATPFVYSVPGGYNSGFY